MILRRSLIALIALLSLSWVAPAFAVETPDDVIVFDGKTVDGKPREVSLADLRKLPKASLTTRTPWYKGATRFEGVLARDVMKLVGARGDTLSIVALDGYAIKVPISDFQTYDAILAYRAEDKDLTVETKGPLFLIYPFDDNPAIANETYYARCIWQIAKIDIK